MHGATEKLEAFRGSLYYKIMFQKLVRSVFLDKGGREALEKSERLEAKNAAQDVNGSKDAPRSTTKTKKQETLADALAKDAAASGPQRSGAEMEAELRDKANATALERSTIQEALHAAHEEIMSPDAQARRRNGGKESAVAALSHEQLVDSAMTIYRQKQSVLEDLDPAARKKLRLMAQTLFNTKPGS